VVGLFPANRVGDDVEIYRDETRTHVLTVGYSSAPADGQSRLCQLPPGGFCRAEAVGEGDYIGAFAVTGGLEEDALADAWEAQHDDANKDYG
jgi:5-methyltetrahydrofolate--homocysteine methyltransferase